MAKGLEGGDLRRDCLMGNRTALWIRVSFGGDGTVRGVHGGDVT